MAQDMENNTTVGSEADQLILEIGEAESQEDVRRFGIDEMTQVWQEKDIMDPVRFLLYDLVSHLAGSLVWAQANETSKANEAAQKALDTLDKLEQTPGKTPSILIRHRGRELEGEGPDSANHDYVIFHGAMRIDMERIKATSKRLGAMAAHRPRMVREAFSALAGVGIRNIRIQADTGGKDHSQHMRQCFSALMRFISTAKTGANAAMDTFAQTNVFTVADENGRPDINLTLLAVINRLNPKTCRALVQKIQQGRKNKGPNHPLSQFPNVYEACFAYKKLRQALTRPPLEVNNPRWLVAAHDWEMVAGHRVQLARLAVESQGPDSLEPARFMDGLFAEDYGSIEAAALSRRLETVTSFINSLEKPGFAPPPLADTAIRNILADMGKNLGMLPDDVFDEFWILADRIELRINERESNQVELDSRLLDLFAFYSQRSITKQKVRLMLNESISFNDRDFGAIARDFGFSVQEARHLVELLKSCFNQNGHFVRQQFDENIPAFAQHQAKVFEFLWHYLKEHLDPGERISFLNGQLQLIDKIHNPQEAIRVLLEDFSNDPEVVRFTDRNALMLANALLRTFNKELGRDIEMTPEEVLLVREGLDKRAVKFTRNLIDEDRQKYFRKIRTIHKKFMEALDPRPGEKTMPPGYLMTLEREAYILVSLVGGVTGLAVLRNALREYGNTESRIYHLKKSRMYATDLLSTLQVVVRAVGRVGEQSDKAFLARMETRAPEFMRISSNAAAKDQARSMLNWINRLLKSG